MDTDGQKLIHSSGHDSYFSDRDVCPSYIPSHGSGTSQLPTCPCSRSWKCDSLLFGCPRLLACCSPFELSYAGLFLISNGRIQDVDLSISSCCF